MDRNELSALVMTAARTLFVNGQSTQQTLSAGERLADRLGLHARLAVRWGEIALHTDGGEGGLVCVEDAEPTGVDMDRVASTMRAVEDVADGRLAPAAARAEIERISRAAPAPSWLFVVAAAAGAAALSVIFGVQHLGALALIAASAGGGAILRRGLSHLSDNAFLQPFCAAVLAGAVGAIAVRYQLSSSLRLVAVCPCMILVPGPDALNGGLDLIRARVHLGAARLIFACLIVAAISTGLLVGLMLFGADLPVDPAGRTPPLWQDVIAAGVAVAAYSIFFSTPLRMLPLPAAIGMLAHALRWEVIAYIGAGPVGGALVACLTVGTILTPLARRLRMPFAAVGFASVVSMMPGVFVFRMASGLLQIVHGPGAHAALIGQTLSDGLIALTVTVAMCLGLLAPKLVIDSLAHRAARRTR